MTYPQPTQNPPPRKHHGVRNGLLIGGGIVTAALILLIGLGAALSGGSNATSPGQPQPVATTTTTPVAPVAATPNPDGKYVGSCDYTLGYPGPYDHLIGEVDLTNTGNIGTKVHVVITWPQEGYAPVRASRDVKVNAGMQMAVRFHIPVSTSGNVITQLQSWQMSHNFAKGCTYKATITGTYGSAS